MYLPSRKAARYLGVHPNTLRNWANAGKIRHIRNPSGQRMYDVTSFEIQQSEADTRRKVCYARVSSSKQKDDLKRQVEFLKERYPEHDIITDIGSGLNFKRKGFLRLLEQIQSGELSEIVVAHKDRLCRFGFELIQHLCDKQSTKLLVLDKTILSPESELTQDLLSIIHAFSCRLHGFRKYHSALQKDTDVPNQSSAEDSQDVDGNSQIHLQ